MTIDTTPAQRDVDAADTTAVGRWEAATEWPLALLAIAFLGSYAWPILQEDLSSDWRATCRWVGIAVWVAFLADLAIRLLLASERGRYISHHIFDIVVVLVPLLRPLRLLRLVMLLRVMNRRATSSLRGRVLIYVVGATALVILCAALAALDAERHSPGANIETFGDSLWRAKRTTIAARAIGIAAAGFAAARREANMGSLADSKLAISF